MKMNKKVVAAVVAAVVAVVAVVAVAAVAAVVSVAAGKSKPAAEAAASLLVVGAENNAAWEANQIGRAHV